MRMNHTYKQAGNMYIAPPPCKLTSYIRGGCNTNKHSPFEKESAY